MRRKTSVKFQQKLFLEEIYMQMSADVGHALIC